MSVLVLWNLGSHDVFCDGRKLEPARPVGEALYQEFELSGFSAEVAARISLPIMQPALEYILRQPPGRIDRLVLFFTNQQDERFRPTDTLWFARLAEQRLKEIFKGRIAAIRLQQIGETPELNPAMLDETLEAYDRLLCRLASPDVKTCYATLTTGIPACNTALLVQGIRYFQERLAVIYSPRAGQPQHLRAGQQIIDTFRENAASQRLSELVFDSALPYLEQLNCSPALIHLARYAAQRLAFDFQAAQVSLEIALRDGDQRTRRFIREQLRNDLEALLSPVGELRRFEALLKELYWNAAIAYQHCRYADFLGRVYRFQEAILRYMVERIYQLPTDLGGEDAEEKRIAWQEGIQANQNLVSYLQQAQTKKRKLDWNEPSRPVYQHLLIYASDEHGLNPAGLPLLSPQERLGLRRLMQSVDLLDPLVELRHRTIVGHDFEGVSKERIDAVYHGNPKPDGSRYGPVEGLAEIISLVTAWSQEPDGLAAIQPDRAEAMIRRYPPAKPKSAYQNIADFICQALRGRTL